MTHTLIVYITTSSHEEANLITETLLQEKLAACTHTYPEIKSQYWWQGSLQEETEIPLIVKTTEANFQPLNKRVQELHSYECPAIVALPIQMGHSDFIQWIKQQCSSHL